MSIPKLINPIHRADWDWANTPIGVVLVLVDCMSGEDDACMCATSQLIPGWWILDDGTWTDTPPERAAEPAPAPTHLFNVQLEDVGPDEHPDGDIMPRLTIVGGHDIAENILAESEGGPVVLSVHVRKGGDQ
jgi:hypothetical protein